MSVLSHGTDFFVTCRVVEREFIDLIIPGGTKKWIILRESCQEFLYFFVIHKTEIPHVNVVKYVRRGGIKMHMNF